MTLNISLFNWGIIIILLSMELAKTNFFSVSLNDNFLANNFAAIESCMNRFKADISILFETTASVV